MRPRGGFVALVRRLNLRHLARHRLRSALTVAGIAAGVALVFSISVINATLLGSFRSSIRDLAGAAELEVASADQSGLPAAAVDQVASVPGVDQAIPALRAITQVRGPRGSARSMIVGITPEFGALFPRDLGPLAQIRISGGFGGGGRGLLLASAVAEELGVGRGDRVTLDSPSGPAEVEVTGRIAGGTIAALNGGRIGVMLLPAAQEVFDERGRVDSIYVVVDPAADLAEVEAAITRTLSGAAIVGPPGERGRGLERVFGSLGTLISVSGTVALFVALFVVYNTMSMALAERRQEISMALALGARRRQVFAAFLTEAGVVGGVASAVGIAGGYVLARLLVEQAARAYHVVPIAGGGPVAVDAGQIIAAAAGGLAVSLAGAYVPARRVLGVAAVEALRPQAAYEWARRTSSAARRAAGVAAAVALIAASVALFFYYVLSPGRRWVITVSLVLALGGITLLLPRIVPLAVALVRPVLGRLFGTIGRLAGDALARHPGRTTFTVGALVLTLGVAIGIGSALSSYEQQVEATATALIGAPIYVTSESYSGVTSDQPLPLSLRDELEAVEGVSFVYPLRFSLFTLRGDQALMYAIPVAEAFEAGITTDLDATTADPQRFITSLEEGNVAVSRLASERYDVQPGDTISLPTPRGEREFVVGAIYDDIVSFASLYIDHERYVELWGDDKADEFGILLEEGAGVPAVKARLDTLIAASGMQARVLTKEQLVGRLLDIIEGTFALGRGIQLAALVVAALTIANTLFTAVFERRWEMGLQRAIGMSGSQLARSVLVEAAAIGAIGGVGGALLGMLNGYVITKSMEAQFAWQIPYVWPLGLIALAIALGIAIAAAAGVFPSRLSARTAIVESLRYE